ncbi:hypothetical protein J3D54_001675 [Pseudomonas sp. GGS8]|uniref:hypothetical protein n=1 Tax=Pseudomonas sp. GGS8 TaxID=2817892 RepID=UPI00209E0F9E|nr:hypothetical protein [Pseudomonas sp. GGS8]MCP1442543.1 hypothetical protein [Pseudomonas sp. GGS8]
MNKETTSKAIIGAKALVALAVLSAAIYWVTGLSSPTKNYVSMPTIIQEAEKIPPPPNAALIEKADNHKTSAALVSSRYKTSLSSGQVFEHYRSNLAQAGWRHTKSSNSLIDEYCKGALRAEIEFNPSMQFYTFSIIWRLRVTTECES